MASRVSGVAINSNVSLAVILRDGVCCVSSFHDGLDRAYLVPQAEKEWFQQNNTQEYNSTLGLANRYWLDDIANSITLRRDIHWEFDMGTFAIVRKSGKWVNHFLKPTNEYGTMYHNREVSIDASVSPHFLLAWFAWAIFPFVTCLVPVRSASGGVILEGGRGEQWGQEENEGSETPDTLSEAFSEAALAFKQDNNRQLPEPPTCLDTFNRTVDHNMSVPISSAT